MRLEALYQEIILDHYRHPHHRGLREPYDAEVHHVNPTCGDEVTLRVLLVDRGAAGPAIVADVSYEGQGCSISQASTSVMTDLVMGKPVAAALELEEEFLALMQSRGRVEPDPDRLEDGIAFAGVAKYPARVKCALLGWMAWKDATARALDQPAREHAAVGSPTPGAPAPGSSAAEAPAPGSSAAEAPAPGSLAPGSSAPGSTAGSHGRGGG